MRENIIRIIDKNELKQIKNECPTKYKFNIDKYVWGGEYRPKTYAEIYFVRDVGFWVRMTCFEKNPIARFYEINDPVHEDSCLEFFADFAPLLSSGYINIEVNANGATHCEFGQGRGDRFQFDANISPKPVVTIGEECWQVEYIVKLEVISKIYGKEIAYEVGDIICGNFYKCGDKTEIEHYGSFAPIGTEFPDFHRPEFFDEFILK